ncbi:MAG: hypothetical protein Q6356_002650 [Candidatus Wukongarchaeota archaeon]|nr:hypothetical protein [Candidatus Wukongarchaeota archaeon]
MTPPEEKAKAEKEAVVTELDIGKGFNATAWGLLISFIVFGIFTYAFAGDLKGAAGFSFLNQANFWVAFLFYLILFTVGFEYWPVAKLQKEKRAVVLFAMCAVAAQLTQYILVEDHPSAINSGSFNYYWLMADLILILLISLLAFEAWPVGDKPQPIKGGVISAEMLVAAILIYYIADHDHGWFGGTGDWMSAMWIPTLFIMIPWLLWYTFLMEFWPFDYLKQPMKGAFVTLEIAVLTFITYAFTAIVPDNPHHFSGSEGGRASDYITFTAVWTTVLVIMIFVFEGWPIAKTRLASLVQPIRGALAFSFTVILTGVILLIYVKAAGGTDDLVGVGGGLSVDEYVLPAVWFYVYVPSWILMISVWLDYHA